MVAVNVNGVLTLLLRNGPAGAGVLVFPVNAQQTIKEAETNGFTTLFVLENQPSLIKREKIRMLDEGSF